MIRGIFTNLKAVDHPQEVFVKRLHSRVAPGHDVLLKRSQVQRVGVLVVKVWALFLVWQRHERLAQFLPIRT